MDEVRGERPLDPAEAKALMDRYGEAANRAVEEGRVLRQRIVKGTKFLAEPSLSAEEREAADERLKSLEVALRHAEWTSTLGLGLAMAWAVGATVIGVEESDGFRPPEGSVVRVYMPGICDVSVKMNGK